MTRKTAPPETRNPEPATPPEAPGPRPQPDRGTSVELIPVDQISSHLPNHREQALQDPEKLAALAGSMAEHGLLQPILVQEHEGGYRLVYGHRRFAAAKLLGWTQIRAEVREPMSDAQVLLERAIENLHRSDLNPMEEVVAIVQAVEAVGGDARKAAKELGLSERFVRDRWLLAERIAPDTAALALAGHLGIGHLRELAKITDRKAQAEIAHDVTSHWDGLRITPSVERVRTAVERELSDLGAAPWRLDVAFAGKPACAGCPSNTTAQPELFDDAGGAGRCTNQACFGEKTRATLTVQSKVVDQLAKRKEAPEPADVVTAAEAAFGRDGLHLDPQAAIRLVKREQKQRARSAGDGGSGRKKLTPLQTAIKKYGEALTSWQRKAELVLEKAVAADPIRYAACLVLGETEAWATLKDSDGGHAAEYSYGGSDQPKEPKPDKPLGNDLIASISLAGVSENSSPEYVCEALGLLGREKRRGAGGRYRRWDWVGNVTAARALAQAIGATLPAPPDWAQMEPKEKTAQTKRAVKTKPAAKKSAKKSATDAAKKKIRQTAG